MKHFYKALILFAFSLITTLAFSKENREIIYTADTQTTEISYTENKIIIQDLPYSGKLQIYSVLGVNIANIDVKSGSGEYAVQLPRGYYIVKIGDVVRKIAVK